MSGTSNIFRKFESEIGGFEKHLSDSKKLKGELDSFFRQVQSLTVGRG